jgi:hypothetical protein
VAVNEKFLLELNAGRVVGAVKVSEKVFKVDIELT